MKLKLYLIEDKARLMKKVNQWKKDLRRMTKLYKSLKSENTPQALKKFKEAQRYFVTFRKNWEIWTNQELLKSKGGKDETYYREQAKVSSWQAEMSINNLFPDSYDYKTDKHEPAPWELDRAKYSKGDTRKNRILVYQKKFKKAFDDIENLINYEADDINMVKDTEQHNIEGINVLVSGRREEKEGYKEKGLKTMMDALPEAVKRIKKSGLNLPLKGLLMDITLSGAGAVGVQSGAGGSYNYSTDKIRMYPMGMGSKADALKTFVHELGHRYYYKNLTEKVRNAWDKAIRTRQVQVKDHHVDSFFQKYVGNIEDESFDRKKAIKQIKQNEKDPTTARVYTHLVHNFPRWFVKDEEDKRENYIKKMKEFERDQWVDLEFVTDYAATKPNESFAEVFAHFVLKPNTLGEWTRAFFKEIVRSGGANIKEGKNMKLRDYLSQEQAKAKPKTMEFELRDYLSPQEQTKPNKDATKVRVIRKNKKKIDEGKTDK